VKKKFEYPNQADMEIYFSRTVYLLFTYLYKESTRSVPVSSKFGNSISVYQKISLRYLAIIESL